MIADLFSAPSIMTNPIWHSRLGHGLLRELPVQRSEAHHHLHTIPSTPVWCAEGPKRSWTINGDFVTLKPTGVPRYAREVTQALDALVAESHPLTVGLDLNLLVPCQPKEPLHLRAISMQVLPEYKRPRLPQFWVQLQLPRHVAGGLLSFCNLAPIVHRRHIVCVHDLHTRLMPDSYSRLFRWAHRLVLPILGRRAHFITTVSELSRTHLIQYRVAVADKIVVTHNGSDHVTRWERQGPSRFDHAPTRPFIFSFGQTQKYKNLDLLIALSKQLDTLGLDIFIAGDVSEAAIQASTSLQLRNVRFLGRVTDAELADLYANALCLVFPSRMEGFGLPVVEAMALGCPVVSSNIPALVEVCGDAAMLVHPDDTQGWLTAIQALHLDPQLHKRMTTRGLERARQFSWRVIAEIYLKLMAKVDGIDNSLLARSAAN
jgi:glycosyltransferase involved in cell wall biosynthesis